MSDRTDGYADAALAVARAEGQLGAIEDDLFRFTRTFEGNDSLPFETYRQRYLAPERLKSLPLQGPD